MEPQRVLVVGAGGHAQVVIDTLLLLSSRFTPVALTDPDAARHGQSVLGVPIAGGDDAWERIRQSGVRAAIVALGDNVRRQQAFNGLHAHGFELINAIHPSASVSTHAVVGRGLAVMAGAVINAGSTIGDGVIVNTGASIDHDCRIADHVHIAPGSHLGGRVTVGDRAFVGLGASVVPGVRIGADAIVGAGAVVIGDVTDGATVVGVPGRPIR